MAVAAASRRRGLHVTVLDRDEQVGGSWARRYDRLHLHSPRIQSHLPGYRIPRRYGRWVARDDLVRYLQDYSRGHGIQPILGVEVQRVDRSADGDGWDVTASDGVRHAGRVVIATGYNNVAVVPEWPGADTFRGELLHAEHYREPSPFVGRRVLVVGTGNTGAEIATDLAEGGAARVHLSVRTPPHIVGRTLLGVPTTLLGIVNEFLPAGVVDPVNRILARLSAGDPRSFGMPVPELGLVAQYRQTDVIPIIDVGLVRALREGRVEPVPAVTGFEGDDVLLAGGQRLTVDAVIAATGYRSGLERIVGHLGVLDEHGRPTVRGGATHPCAPGLYFVGLRNPLIGLLLSIRLDAQRTARVLATARR